MKETYYANFQVGLAVITNVNIKVGNEIQKLTFSQIGLFNA